MVATRRKVYIKYNYRNVSYPKYVSDVSKHPGQKVFCRQ